MKKLLSANRLLDGAVVYLTEQGSWSVDLDQAWLLTPDTDDLDRAEALGRAAEARNIVVGPYTIDALDTAGIHPARLRERIRAEGPTVLDHQIRERFGTEG